MMQSKSIVPLTPEQEVYLAEAVIDAALQGRWKSDYATLKQAFVDLDGYYRSMFTVFRDHFSIDVCGSDSRSAHSHIAYDRRTATIMRSIGNYHLFEAAFDRVVLAEHMLGEGLFGI